MQSSRPEQSARGATATAQAPVASSRSHHHRHQQQQAPPSTVRSVRYDAVPMSSSASMAQGPLTQERNMMETIRLKLERAQQRLAHQHAMQSATPGSSRYYPPNYESTKARTPAPPVQSVKLEDFSLQQQQYVSQRQHQPPPSSTTSGYMGVYPAQPPSTYRGGFVDPHGASQRHHHQQPQPSQHRDRGAAAGQPPASARPGRQPVPAPENSASVKSSRPSASRHHRQQYPPELQYKSSSRNTTTTNDYQGTPLSTSAPFLAYSTSHLLPHASQKHQQFAPPSPMQVPASEAERQYRHHRHDRTREPPPSAMRNAMQAPPSSRVRFEGHLDEFEEEERAKAKLAADRAVAAEKAKERQREKEELRREMLRLDRQKGSLSHDAAEQQQQYPPVDRQERTRRGSLPTPPKSEIDINVLEQVKFSALPASPSAAGRNRRSSAATTVAAPPKSAIQASAFEEAPVRRRSSAADELPPVDVESLKEEKNSAKRDVSSDEDDYTTPPTSPSSGGSSSSSGPESASRKVEEQPSPTQHHAATPESTSVSETPIQVSVKAQVHNDYDHDFVYNQKASPTNRVHLSIWDEADEDAIISSSDNSHLTPKPQDLKRQLIWDDGDELSDEVEDASMSNQEEEIVVETIAFLKELSLTSPYNQEEFNAENVAPLNHAVSSKHDAVPEVSFSNQELSPAKKPQDASPVPSSTSSSAYLGSRTVSPARPDLRSRISAAIQALNSPDAAAPAKEASSPSPAPLTPSPAALTPSPATHSPPLHPASEPRAAPTASMAPSRTSAAFQRPPSTTVGRPSVTRPRAPLVPPAPHSMHPASRSHLPPPPPSTARSMTGSQTRRLRHREPLELKRQLPPQIGVLAGLSSGPNTFMLDETKFYEIEWRTGEFGFSFQRVYAKEQFGSGAEKAEMFLRMLLNTDRGTCRSFHEVRVGDILIQIGDTKVSDLGFDSAAPGRDSGSALTKYFTELRMQTPIRLVFQRTEVLDWEGGVEL